MKHPVRLLFASLLVLAPLALLRAQPAVPKPGFAVVLEITYDEQGAPEEAKVVQSDDPTGERVLEQVSMNLAAKDHQPPRVKDGKAVKFKARRAFNFPVEDDQGPGANTDRPMLRKEDQPRPVYPPALAEKGEIGGAIVELTIGADGVVKGVRTLRASHPEFAQAAEQALGHWTFNPQTGPGTPAESHWRAAVCFSVDGKVPDLKWRLAPRPALGSFTVGHITAAAQAAAAAANATAPAPATDKK